MGWYLQAINTELSNYDTTELFGSNVKVTLLMSYKPELNRKLVETPLLDWHEKIIMVEHHKRERWVFETNMYEHNPLSKTLEIWPKRYIEAFDFATRGAPNAMVKGFSKLLDQRQQVVPARALGAAMTPADKANAVRNYLAANGGYLDIQIHDIPSINKPRPGAGGADHKERLLLFNCGVVGGAHRQLAQLLDVDQAQPQSSWTRRCEVGWFQADLPLPPGYANVQPPAGVSMPRQPVFTSGEYK